MNIINLNKNNFKEEVLNSNIPVLVDFYADWCAPCRMIAPAIESIATDYKGQIKTCKLNIDSTPDIPSQYGVMSIPTIIFFKNGTIVDQFTGILPQAQIEEYIKKHI